MHPRDVNIPQLLKISSECTQENKQIGFGLSIILSYYLFLIIDIGLLQKAS